MNERKSETGGETGVPRARARGGGGEGESHSSYVGALSIHLILPHYLHVCCKIVDLFRG